MLEVEREREREIFCESTRLVFVGCLCERVCLCEKYMICSGMYVGDLCKCVKWYVFLCAAKARFCVLLCVTHVVGLSLLFFFVFFFMRVHGRVFVCVGLRAQYPSCSLWSLRGSFSPEPTAVSVLVWAPGATMTAQPSRFAHQVHQIGSLT